jgi:hypothetical protein
VSAPLKDESGDADLCFQFTSPLADPFYTVGAAALEDRR